MDFIHKSVCAVIALLVLCNTTLCQNECTYSMNITPGHHYQITNPSFPNYYTPGIDCTWDITTVRGHLVKLACNNIYMPTSDSSCKDYLAVTTTGDLRDASAFCVPFTVAGSSLTIQLISSRWSSGGNFSCDITTEEIPVTGTNQTENCECGWSHSTRIVGGHEAEINEFPSMAMVVQRSRKGSTFCGATIIAQTVALSAAHCFTNDPEPSNYWLLVGDHDITTSDETSSTKLVEISRIIVHPNASESQGHEDIALLVTAIYIKFTSRVGPACLPFNIKQEDLVGKYVTIAGWGDMNENGFASKRLQKVNMRIVPDSKGFSIYKKIKTVIPQYHLWTYDIGKTHCYGDSGGPLYYYNHQKNCQVVVGIVSGSLDCSGSKPSYNVDVHHYLPWILDQLPDVEFCKK